MEILSGRSTPRVIVTKPTTNNKTVTTTPPASAATRRSKRLESKTTIDAKKTLGTPHLEKLVKKKRVEKALASVQIKEDSDESSSSSESEDEDDDEEEEEDEDQEKQRIQTEKFVIGDQTNDVGQGNGARNEDADMDEGEGDDEEAIIEAGASGRGVVGGRTYFSAFNSGNKRNETSDNTLSKLPPLTHDQYVKEMGSLTEKHASDLRLLCSLHLKSFPQYLFELHNDFNLLFYGFGSKMELLTRFAKDYLLTQARDGPVVVVNGFSPALTIKAVLNDIIRNVLLRVGPIGSLIDQVETIRKHFSKYPAHNQTLMKRLSVTKKPIVQESSQGGREDEVMDDCGDGIGVVNQRKEKEEEEKDEEDEVDDDSNLPKRLYILVHNIDGQSLRADKCQHLLASLARIPNVHLIASVDHINSPFLWNNALSTSFNWAWHDMTNFSGYTSETAFETSLLARLTSDNSGGGGAGVVGLMSHTSLGGVMFVLRSLPMNGRRLFKELVDYQMSEMKEKRLSMAAAAAAATAEAQRLQEEHDKEEEEDMAREMEKDGENEDESENNNRKRCLPRRAASMRSRKRAPVVAVSIPAIKRINPSECSISSRDLFRRCQERFIAQSDPQFR